VDGGTTEWSLQASRELITYRIRNFWQYVSNVIGYYTAVQAANFEADPNPNSNLTPNPNLTPIPNSNPMALNPNTKR
jgi:hypothetical protein